MDIERIPISERLKRMHFQFFRMFGRHPTAWIMGPDVAIEFSQEHYSEWLESKKREHPDLKMAPALGYQHPTAFYGLPIILSSADGVSFQVDWRLSHELDWQRKKAEMELGLNRQENGR